MLKISWTEKVSNQQVLDTIREEATLVGYIGLRQRYVFYFYLELQETCLNAMQKQ